MVFKTFLHQPDTQILLKEIIEPVAGFVYNEIYLYVWILCLYNVLLFLFVLAILLLLWRIERNSNRNPFPLLLK